MSDVALAVRSLKMNMRNSYRCAAHPLIGGQWRLALALVLTVRVLSGASSACAQGQLSDSEFRTLLAELRQPEGRSVALTRLVIQSDATRHPEIVRSLKELFEEQDLSVTEIRRLAQAIGRLGPSALELLPYVHQVWESPEVDDKDRGFALGAIARIAGGQAALQAWKKLEPACPEFLIYYLAEFVAETRGTLNAPQAIRDEFRHHVLEMIGSDKPDVRKLAMLLLFAAYDRDVVVRTAEGWRVNPELEKRLSEVAQSHADAEWRGRVGERLEYLRANAEHLATRWERWERRQQPGAGVRPSPTEPDQSPDFVLPFELEWPSDKAGPREWRATLQDAVRHLIEARCGASGRELTTAEKRNIDLHVRLWSEPAERLREPLLTRDGVMWYLESVDAFQASFVDAPKRPPTDELQRAVRTRAECSLAEKWVSSADRASRQKSLFGAVSSLVDLLKIPERSFGLVAPDGSSLDESAHERAISSLSTNAAMRRARILSTNIFYAKSAAHLEMPPAWAVVVRNVLDDLRSGTLQVQTLKLEQALPSLVDAVFWNPQTGECSQRAYRDALQAARRIVSGEAAASPLP